LVYIFGIYSVEGHIIIPDRKFFLEIGVWPKNESAWAKLVLGSRMKNLGMNYGVTLFSYFTL
jgi:hypothetical protein